MEKSVRILLFATICMAVFFGFAPNFWLGRGELNFAVLHVFLFNLTAGGTLVTAWFRGKKRMDTFGAAFYLFAIVFTIGAAFHYTPACVATALVLSAMVESVRWKRFSLFPDIFFKRAPVSDKFGHAALLCLSSGLAICAATLVNNEYLKLFYLEKLDMHVFFLGFSFPISLSIFSTVFKRIESTGRHYPRIFGEFCFWGLNLGVISFFFFIIFEIYPLQMVAALALFGATILTIIMHVTRSERGDEWLMLSSAFGFLILGSLTGIFYVLILWKSAAYTSGGFMSLHSAATIFGWNLTWILVTSRHKKLPLAVGTGKLVVMHWAFVLLIPPARTDATFSVIATIACLALLGLFFFSPPSDRTNVSA